MFCYYYHYYFCCHNRKQKFYNWVREKKQKLAMKKLLFVIVISLDGNCPGVNIRGVVQQSQVGIVKRNCPGSIALGGNCLGDNCPRWHLPRGQLSRGQLSVGQLSRGTLSQNCLHQHCPNQTCQLPSCCSQLRGNLHTCSYTESHVFVFHTDFDCQINSCSELWTLVRREQVTERKQGGISMIIDFDCKIGICSK